MPVIADSRILLLRAPSGVQTDEETAKSVPHFLTVFSWNVRLYWLTERKSVSQFTPTIDKLAGFLSIN